MSKKMKQILILMISLTVAAVNFSVSGAVFADSFYDELTDTAFDVEWPEEYPEEYQEEYPEEYPEEEILPEETEEYDQDVKEAIRIVGREYDIDDEWLNNDCSFLEGFLDELATEINWIKADYSFENIDFYVADYVGMVKTKSKAIHDGGLVPRKTDKKDLLLLLKMEGIDTIDEVDKDERFGFIKDKYERTYDFLNGMKTW